MQDLPAPPTEEAWAPPEVEGESPSASLQNLVDLFRVPLMTKVVVKCCSLDVPVEMNVEQQEQHKLRI